MYNQLFLIITIASFSFIQSYSVEDISQNFTITLDEEGNIVTISNGTQFTIQIQNFVTAIDAFNLELDNILKDYKHKEIIKHHIQNFISETTQNAISVMPEPIPEPEPEPILPDPIHEPEPQPDIGFDIESAKRMGIFETGCAWHLSPLFESLLTLNKEESERIIYSFADCTEKYYDNKAKDDAVTQAIELHQEKTEVSSLFYLLLAIPIALVVPSIRKKLLEILWPSKLS